VNCTVRFPPTSYFATYLATTCFRIRRPYSPRTVRMPERWTTAATSSVHQHLLRVLLPHPYNPMPQILFAIEILWVGGSTTWNQG
jgi:hypothetical protein